MLLGAHRSTAGGLHNAILSGQEIGCEAVQLFVKNCSQWEARPLTEEEVATFHRTFRESSVKALVAHDSYLINLASPEPDRREKSIQAFIVELDRCAVLGLPRLVTHLGAHRGAGERAGLATLTASLNEIHRRRPAAPVRILLETTAGQGTSLGYRFEHLAEVLEGLDESERVGVCFDTCHVFAAGYDLRTPEAYKDTMAAFGRIVGDEKLEVFHVNDSRRELGCRVDRHARIGQGELGDDAFRCLLRDERCANRPLLLETPGLENHAADLARLRRLRKT
jgi:deoxyribonuclease-4